MRQVTRLYVSVQLHIDSAHPDQVQAARQHFMCTEHEVLLCVIMQSVMQNPACSENSLIYFCDHE